MPITPDQLTGVDETLARRVIAAGRFFAPCIDDLTDPDALADAIAILTGVAEEVAERGSLHVLSERAGGVGVSYATVRSWFTHDDRAGLRSLCAAAGSSGPVGSFPERRFVADMWPEDC